MELTAVLTPAREGGFNALNPETGTASQGDTLDEAMANLLEAVELYLDERFSADFAGTSVVKQFSVEAAMKDREADDAHMRETVARGLASGLVAEHPRKVLGQIMAEHPAHRG